MTGSFEVVRDPVLGEEVWLATTSRGLRLRLVPTGRFQDACGVVTVGYGSTDLGFVRADGSPHRSPEGVAHYLEHKLFEAEDLHVFERFGRRGARVNAMTGFTRTSYHFQASSRVGENLDDLLFLVSRAHLTEENVEKERGIIAQELRMYEDSADYRGFFDLLGCLYGEHPVRHPVGGTVASIAGIDVAELQACFDAFYRTGNATLAVAGPIDPDAVLEAAERCAMPAGQAPARIGAEDLGPARSGPARTRMEVARPRLLIGYKERSLLDEPEARLRRDLTTRILLDRLFGGSSAIRERLHADGLVDDTLSASYLGDRSFGVAVIGCESERPEQVAAVLRGLLERPLEIDEDFIERVRRKMLGGYVRSFDSVQSMAFAHAEEALLGVAPFRQLERFGAVSAADVRARQAELCQAGSCAVALLEP
jgi:predicted Zn-dependent peptidase